MNNKESKESPYFFRRMLRLHLQEDRRRRLGLGLVAGDGRPEAVPGGDDVEPHLRERGDRTGRAAHCYWGGAGI